MFKVQGCRLWGFLVVLLCTQTPKLTNSELPNNRPTGNRQQTLSIELFHCDAFALTFYGMMMYS